MEANFHPWDRFNEWIHSLCVVTFDLEIGQALEIIYPGDAELSTTEKTNLCYLAFPDSNSGNSKDTNFHFRIRRSTTTVTAAQERLLETLPSSAGFDPRFLYGFVHFRQEKDPSLPRGYFQKSLVLISILPFFNLFSAVVQRIANQFFAIGEPALEAACHDIDQWPEPVAGATFSLPLLGITIRGRIPALADMPFDPRISNPQVEGYTESIVLSSVHQVDVFRSLNSALNHIHILWELILIGEPLLVIASNPAKSSAVVQSLLSLISPLKYLNDFRPFFTIHDSEFKEYSAPSKAPPKVLLGVTNPFFIKALDHWPHILKVNDSSDSESLPEKQDKTRKHWDGKVLDSKPGLYTQYKPYLQKDKALAKRLLKGDRPDEAQCSIIRRHFLELTQSFMIPLERYLSSLMPLRKEMSPFRSVPTSRAFSMNDFLASLEGSGPSLTCGVKGDWEGLYKKFIGSSNFVGWLSGRTRDVSRQLNAAYIEALCAADLGASVLSTKHHVEIVDLVLRIRQRVTELSPENEKRGLLIKQIVGILGAVDAELKQVLMSNCSLREIIT